DEYLAEKNSSNVIEYTNWNGDRAQWILEPVSSSRSAIEKIQTEDTSQEFAVYPNPSSNGVFTISVNGAKSLNVSLFNMLGAQIYNVKVNGDRLKTAPNIKLNTGVYFVKVLDEKNIMYTKRLMVR
ncbi:MAG: T9SS type A sorting domain-containing protein, partial [Leeuwenhoekiella sp.]